MIKIASKTAPSVKIAFYLGQAEECGKAAASATLQNVRDRSLRSEAAWRKMARDIDGEAETTHGEVEDATVAGAVVPGIAISTSTPAFASFG